MTVENESLDNKDKKGNEESLSEDNSTSVDSKPEVVKNEIDKTSKEFKDLVAEEVEKIIQSRISREVQKTKAIENELDQLKTQNEELLNSNQNLKSIVSNVEMENIYYKVALEDGISFNIVQSLKGDNYDELKEAVKNIKNIKSNNVDNIFDGKSYGKVAGGMDFDAMIKNMKM